MAQEEVNFSNDSFFIEEPQKLGNNFFTKDKSIQIVELLAKKHNERIGKKLQLKEIQPEHQPIRRMYQTRRSQRLLALHQVPVTPQPAQQETSIETVMPKSLIERLEFLCKASLNADQKNEFDIAKCAVDTLVNASEGGCCFLEKYMVMLLNFCTVKYSSLNTKGKTVGNRTKATRNKIDELFKRVLSVDFDRHQLTENLRRPEYRIDSVDHIIQLLSHVQDTLDYRDKRAIDWLSVLIDAYFVDLATSDEAVDIIAHINNQIDSECALVREAEGTKSLLKSTLEFMDATIGSSDKLSELQVTSFYSIEQIIF